MTIELRQNLRLTQQLLMTPHLQQAIKLLQLSRFELCEFINQQVLENPVLEEVGESSGVANSSAENKDNKERQQERAKQERIQDSGLTSRKELSSWYENIASAPKSLSEHLLQQIGCSHLSQPQRKIAVLLLGYISERGFLEVTLEEFCKKEKVKPKEAEYVLEVVQSLDPSGVGSRSLEECLLIQLEDLGIKDKNVEVVIKEHLQSVVDKNYPLIAKKMKISVGRVLECVATIAGLDPIPGRSFGLQAIQYIIPDVYVFKLDKKWAISLNKEGLSSLRLNDYYIELEKTLGKGLEKDYLSDQIKSAEWLIKSLEQRQHSIYRVVEGILEKQKEFFEKGIEFLKPLTLKEVAEISEVHESTVSRVTRKKYVHTSRGLFELKFFFNRSLISSNGEELASEYVRSLLKDLIAKEDLISPYTDSDLVLLLQQKGIVLARRTIAKYRETMRIASSQKRKKFS
jgi:RNA polymerase sigma-54 factor